MRSRLQIPDCTVTYSVGDSNRAMKKNKHKKNVKDLECKITNLRRRGAVRSARFSSVDLKVGPVVSLRAAQQTALGSSVFI